MLNGQRASSKRCVDALGDGGEGRGPCRVWLDNFEDAGGSVGDSLRGVQTEIGEGCDLGVCGGWHSGVEWDEGVDRGFATVD